MVKKLNEQEFRDVIKLDKPSLICFGATWCGKCSMAKQKFASYEESLNNIADIYQIDADECKSIFEEYKVEHMPVFILFKNGFNLGQRSALGTPEGIKDFVNNLLKN